MNKITIRTSLSGILLASGLLAAAPLLAQDYLVPRTPDGQPSFHGVWTNDTITPMEARFGVEMAVAASRLKREQASEIVNRLLEKYESQIGTPPPGSRYLECYDVVSGKPNEAYLRLYGEAKEELAGMGIPFE